MYKIQASKELYHPFILTDNAVPQVCFVRKSRVRTSKIKCNHLFLLLQDQLIFLVQHFLESGHFLLQLGYDDKVISSWRVQSKVWRKTTRDKKSWLIITPLLPLVPMEEGHMGRVSHGEENPILQATWDWPFAAAIC